MIHLSPCSNGTAETRWGKPPQPNRPLPLNDSVQSYSNCNYEGEISWSSSDEMSHWIYDLRYHYSSRKSTAISAGIEICYSRDVMDRFFYPVLCSLYWALLVERVVSVLRCSVCCDVASLSVIHLFNLLLLLFLVKDYSSNFALPHQKYNLCLQSAYLRLYFNYTQKN